MQILSKCETKALEILSGSLIKGASGDLNIIVPLRHGKACVEFLEKNGAGSFAASWDSDNVQIVDWSYTQNAEFEPDFYIVKLETV